VYEDRREGPPLSSLRQLRFIYDTALCCGRVDRVDARIRGASGDPRLEIGDDLICQLAARRHLQMRVGIFHRVNQFAVARFARNERGSERATLHQAFSTVQSEVALGLLHLAVMARVTLRCEDRSDSGLEKFVGDLCKSWCRNQEQEEEEEPADKGAPEHGHETSHACPPLRSREGGKLL
jgi:hypothetical protein